MKILWMATDATLDSENNNCHADCTDCDELRNRQVEGELLADRGDMAVLRYFGLRTRKNF